jgi:hypothetical protein
LDLSIGANLPVPNVDKFKLATFIFYIDLKE